MPDILAEETELERLRQAIQPVEPIPLSMASFDQAPINEWQNKCVFRMAFPSLFPNGLGDFNLPRSDNITMKDWIRHLLRYKDERFARHPRFRYMAYNTSMRMEAKKSASYVCKKVGGRYITIDELRELVREGNTRLSTSIVRSAEQLRGTRPYWKRRAKELEDMVLNLNAPQLFFTFSAADLQWRDLKRHMPGYERLSELTEQQEARLAAKNLTDNPHVAAAYLVKRFELFFQCVLKKIFEVKDYWYRFEWQDRGSGHMHGFLWLEGPPPVKTRTPEQRQAIATYWADIVTAVNPFRTLPFGRNPASLMFSERQNSEKHLADCLNRYQRHSICTPGYCLRKVKGSEDMRCRFYFPQAYRTVPDVNRDLNPKHYKFMPVRNDTLLNAYIPTTTLGWNANTDVSPCTNIGTVLRYAAKYASKSEVKTDTYKELFQKAIETCSDRNPFLSTAMKMVNRLIAERDWSAQEMNHICLGLDLVKCNREFATLDLRPNNEQVTTVDVEEGELTQKGRSWLEKYTKRMEYERQNGDDSNLAEVSLFDFVRNWVVDKKVVRRRPRALPRILQIFPRYPSNPTEPTYEDYCRVKVTLHHPFSELIDLQMPNEDGELSYQSAYRMCMAEHEHPQDPLDIWEESKAEPDEGYESDSDLESQEDDEQNEQAEWMELAARNGMADRLDRADTTGLGKRPIDLVYDWHASDQYYERFGEQSDWYDQAKLNEPEENRTRNDPETLNEGQRTLFDVITNHYSDTLNAEQPPQLLLQVDGKAGAGKSYLIDMASTRLFDMAQHHGIRDPVLRAAPTGIAAFSINGQTLHRLLRLPVRGSFEPLSNAVLLSLQQSFTSCKYLIIDEKSMIGLLQLFYIDHRLREIFPNRSDEPFGGMNIILCGDFYQLPPVAMSPLYDTRPATKVEIAQAQVLYKRFDRTVRLTTIMRQQGEDEESVQFRTVLDGLRHGDITEAGFEFLLRRVKDSLDPNVREEFGDALRIYPTRNAVAVHNVETLVEKGLPILRIEAKHSPPKAKNGSDEDAEGLRPELLVSKGCRMMITSNLLTSFGLVNGTLGTLLDVV